MSDLNEQVSAVLRYVLSLPVNVSDGNFREAKATRRYEAHHSKEGVMAYLGSVLGWLPLNPSDEGIREAISEDTLAEWLSSAYSRIHINRLGVRRGQSKIGSARR